MFLNVNRSFNRFLQFKPPWVPKNCITWTYRDIPRVFQGYEIWVVGYNVLQGQTYDIHMTYICGRFKIQVYTSFTRIPCWFISVTHFHTIQRSLISLYYQPKQCHVIFGKSLKMSRIFLLFESPKMGLHDWWPPAKYFCPKTQPSGWSRHSFFMIFTPAKRQ